MKRLWLIPVLIFADSMFARRSFPVMLSLSLMNCTIADIWVMPLVVYKFFIPRPFSCRGPYTTDLGNVLQMWLLVKLASNTGAIIFLQSFLVIVSANRGYYDPTNKRITQKRFIKQQCRISTKARNKSSDIN